MGKLQTKLQVGCLVLVGLSAFLASRCIGAMYGSQEPLTVVCSALGSLLGGLLSLLLWDIQRWRPADSHGIQSLIHQYRRLVVHTLISPRAISCLHEQSKHVKATQQAILLDALEACKDTVIGKEYKFVDIKSMDEYKRYVPLSTYKDIEPLVDRIAKGEQNVLSCHPTLYFARSSGTTGKPKLIPLTKNMAKSFYDSVAVGLGSFYGRCQPDLGRVVGLRYKCSVDITESGIQVSAMSQFLSQYQAHFVSPRAVYDIMDQSCSHYLHAVFGLQEREVTMLDAKQCPLVLSFFRNLESNWPKVCNDIARGCLDDSLPLAPNIRDSLNSELTPNPGRAQELVQEFEKGFMDIGRRVWPKLTTVWATNTGSFAVQAKILADVYLKGVYQLSIAHGASEGLVGSNMASQFEVGGQVVYTCHVTATFYEFIPVEQREKENPDTLFLHQLTLGREYEVVMTNLDCLYRYRLGDVIKVVDFLNQLPIYEFQYRAGQILDLNGEKTSEKHFKDAIDIVMATLPSDVLLVDYTTTDTVVLTEIATGNSHTDLGNNNHKSSYVAFLELERKGQPFLLSKEQLSQFDEKLQVTNIEYGADREGNYIGPMVVYQVALGTFCKLQKQVTAKSNTMQYKTPRVLRTKELLQMVLDWTVCEVN